MGKKENSKNQTAKEGITPKENQVDIVTKYATGNYGPGDSKRKLSNAEVLEIVSKENLEEPYIKSL